MTKEIFKEIKIFSNYVYEKFFDFCLDVGQIRKWYLLINCILKKKKKWYDMSNDPLTIRKILLHNRNMWEKKLKKKKKHIYGKMFISISE